MALDAKTGKELWKATVVDYTQGSVITSPPLVVKDKVITGFGGGEYGVRGSCRPMTSTPASRSGRPIPCRARTSPTATPGKATPAEHGGGAPWLVGSYDPKTNTVFWGTTNPGPWNTAVRSTGDGNFGKLTNLYTASTLAFDADTGKIKWWVQATPADAWDYDGVNELVLADLKIGGETVPAMMKADRNGFFYVVNRETGKIVSAEKYVPTTWANKRDITTSARGRRPGQAARPNHPAKGRLPEPDRRQELAADVVQSATRASSTSRPTTSAWTGRSPTSTTSGRVLSRRRIPAGSGPGGYSAN